MTLKTEDQDLSQSIPEVSFDEFPPVTYEEWRKEAEVTLKGAPFDKRLRTRTYEGITLEPLYMEENTADFLQKTTLPGEIDFLRGTAPLGYIEESWSVAQSVEKTLPREANAVLRQELKDGTGAVSLVLDSGTLRCRDAETDGRRGLSLSTREDVKTVFEGIDTAEREFHIFAGPSAAPLLGLFAAGLEGGEKDSPLAGVKGCIGADPLGMLARDGRLPASLETLYDEMARTARWAKQSAPSLKTVLVSGDMYHEGGASAVQELACAMATGTAYIRALLERGLDIESAAAQMRFSFSQGLNFFMEIAKLRAARMLWSQIIEAFGGDESAREIDIFANTSSFTTTVYDPYVNVLRGTTEAFSAVVGGINGMNVRPFDEAVGQSTPASRRIARNIQILLKEEFNLLQPVDPAGGSWYIEALTKQVAESAWKMFQQIDGEGGMAGALTSGFIQREIAAVLASRFANLDTRSDRAVGTNMYPNTTEQPLLREESDSSEIQQKRTAAIEDSRKDGDTKARQERLGRISPEGSAEPADFMKGLTEAFNAGATLCEVRERLNGSQKGPEAEPIRPRRWTEQYEALRRRTEEFAATTGKNIRIFLANMGPLVQHKPRADFSRAFMEVAGFEVLKNSGFSTVEEAVAGAAQSGADAAVICSTDETYPELVPPLARGIKESSPGMMVLLAGAPAPEYKESYVDAGVDEFIHVRANCRQILENIQRVRGIV